MDRRDKEEMAKFSVILTVYNESRWLINWIDKMAVQYPDEFIVVNNCSTDNTLALLKCLSQRWPNIRVIHSVENLGAFGGFITGAKAATNDFVASYSPDDEPAPNYITKMSQAMDDYPFVDIYTSNCKVIREGKEYSRILFPYDAYISPDYMVKICKAGLAKMVNLVGMVMRKSVILNMWERGGKDTVADFDAAFAYYMIFNKGLISLSDKLTIFRSYPNSWGATGKAKEKKKAILVAKKLFKANPVVYNRAIESRIWGAGYQWKQKIGLWGIMKLPRWAREMFYRWFYHYDWRIEKLC